MKDRCDGCRASFNVAPRETLCASCFVNRAIERRVDLVLSDLVPCEFNRWGKPSWFDLFSQL